MNRQCKKEYNRKHRSTSVFPALASAAANARVFRMRCSSCGVCCAYLMWRRSHQAHPLHRPGCEWWRRRELLAARRMCNDSLSSTSPRRKRLPHEEEEALRKACRIDGNHRGRQGDALVAAFPQEAIHQPSLGLAVRGALWLSSFVQAENHFVKALGSRWFVEPR